MSLNTKTTLNSTKNCQEKLLRLSFSQYIIFFPTPKIYERGFGRDTVPEVILIKLLWGNVARVEPDLLVCHVLNSTVSEYGTDGNIIVQTPQA